MIIEKPCFLDRPSALVINIQEPRTITGHIENYAKEIFIALACCFTVVGLLSTNIVLASIGIVSLVSYVFYAAVFKRDQIVEIDIKNDHIKSLIKQMEIELNETKKRVDNMKDCESGTALLKDINFRMDVFKTLYFYGIQKYNNQDVSLKDLKINLNVLQSMKVQLESQLKNRPTITISEDSISEPNFIKIIRTNETDFITKINPPIVFKNDGNRCYLNSIIQLWLSIPQVRKCIREPYDLFVKLQKEWDKNQSNSTSEQSWQESFCEYVQGTEIQQLLIKMLDKLESEDRSEDCSCENELMQIRKILFSGKLHSEFNGYEYEQCDAKSVLEVLMELYNKDFKLTTLASATIEGDLVTSKNTDKDLLIRLGLSPNNTSTFQELIDNEFSVQKNINERDFDHKGQKKSLTAYESIVSLDLVNGAPPEMLMIQLKRFGLQENKLVKFDEAVQFPKDFEIDFTKAFDKDLLKGQSTKYALRSVVFHSGSLPGGHYFSHVRERNNWYLCDDQKSQIELIPNEEVHPEEGYLFVLERQ